jgi:hypothetical protein
MLKWVHSQGCPWHKDTRHIAAKIVEVLQWDIDYGCPESITDGEYDDV